MRYTIMGFSQSKLVELGLDTIDTTILRYFVDFKESNGMKFEVVEGKPYYWIQYDGVLRELPILKLKKCTIQARLFKMRDAGVLTHYVKREGGTYSYFGFGDKYFELIGSYDYTNAPKESRVLEADGKREVDKHSLKTVNNGCEAASYIMDPVNNGWKAANHVLEPVNNSCEATSYILEPMNNSWEATDHVLEGMNNKQLGIECVQQGITENIQAMESSEKGITENIQAMESSQQGVAENLQGIAVNQQGIDGNFEGCGTKLTTKNSSTKDSSTKSINTSLEEEAIEIIDYLNTSTGKHFRSNTKATVRLIKEKRIDGFTVKDFKTVIDNMKANWTGTRFEQYLAPTTLFGAKFETYLNVDKDYSGELQKRGNVSGDSGSKDISKDVEVNLILKEDM